MFDKALCFIKHYVFNTIFDKALCFSYDSKIFLLFKFSWQKFLKFLNTFFTEISSNILQIKSDSYEDFVIE